MAVPVNPKAYLASVLVLYTPGVPALPPLLRSMDCFYGGASFGAFLVSLLQIWLGSGIPLTLSVVGVCSALSPPFWSSGPLLRSEYAYSRCCSVSAHGNHYRGMTDTILSLTRVGSQEYQFVWFLQCSHPVS